MDPPLMMPGIVFNPPVGSFTNSRASVASVSAFKVTVKSVVVMLGIPPVQVSCKSATCSRWPLSLGTEDVGTEAAHENSGTSSAMAKVAISERVSKRVRTIIYSSVSHSPFVVLRMYSRQIAGNRETNARGRVSQRALKTSSQRVVSHSIQQGDPRS